MICFPLDKGIVVIPKIDVRDLEIEILNGKWPMKMVWKWWTTVKWKLCWNLLELQLGITYECIFMCLHELKKIQK